MSSAANLKATEAIALLGTIDPDAYAAGTYATGWVQVDDFAAYMALIAAGDLGASATLDAKIRQATDGSGTGAKDVTGKAITQLTQAGTDSNKQALINFKASDLDLAAGFTFVQISMTVATAASDASAHLFGFGAKQAPASSYDDAAVDEIVG